MTPIRLAIVVAVLGLVVLQAARADAPPNSVTLCYDDAAGATCKTNLYVSADDVWLLGDFIVCTDHVVTSAAGSEQCPATTPGVYYACTPTALGYCNATLVSWKDIRFAVKVSATVGAANLTMANVGLRVENWTAQLDGVPQSSFLGDASSIVSVPADGAVHLVEFLKVTSTGPGIGGGGTPTPPTPTPTLPSPTPPAPTSLLPTSAPSLNGDGIDVIFARIPSSAAAAAASPQSRIVLALIGLLLVVAGDADLGKRLHVPKHKPRPWLAAIGGVLLVLAVATLLAP